MGSLGGVGVTEHRTTFIQRHYESFKNQSPIFGFFFLTKPILVPTDPDLIKDILVNNFHNFHGRGIYVDKDNDPLNTGIFFTKGQQWKDLRSKMSPNFTTGKIKMMFPIVLEKANRMVEFLSPTAEKGESIDMKEVVTCFTTETIASVAFGLDVECFGNPENSFLKLEKAVFHPTFFEVIKSTIVFSSETITRIFKLGFTRRETTEFVQNMVRDTMEFREKQNVVRSDFFQLMLDVKRKNLLSFNEVAANCYTFFLAG